MQDPLAVPAVAEAHALERDERVGGRRGPGRAPGPIVLVRLLLLDGQPGDLLEAPDGGEALLELGDALDERGDRLREVEEVEQEGDEVPELHGSGGHAGAAHAEDREEGDRDDEPVAVPATAW